MNTPSKGHYPMKPRAVVGFWEGLLVKTAPKLKTGIRAQINHRMAGWIGGNNFFDF